MAELFGKVQTVYISPALTRKLNFSHLVKYKSFPNAVFIQNGCLVGEQKIQLRELIKYNRTKNDHIQ